MRQERPPSRASGEAGVSPVIGTMFIFVIIVMGLSGALAFGVPTIQTLQERAAFDEMATQLEAVRDEAEKVTVGGAGAVVALAPTEGTLSIEEGTRMAVAVSYNGSSEQQGLALAWGKGGKKKATTAPEVKACDFHVQQWEDGDNTVKLVASDCYEPMRYDPADGGSAGTTLVQTLGVSSVTSATGWSTPTQAKLLSSDNAYANFSTEDPSTTNDLQVAIADPSSTPDTISGVVVKAEVSVAGVANPNDGFKLKLCLASDCRTSTKQGSSANDVTIDYDATGHRPGGGTWAWSDIPNLEAAVQLVQQGNSADGTWRVDRVWVEVTSTPATNQGNSGKCYNSNGYACLQAFKISDPAGVNRITSIAAVAGQSDTYLVTMNATIDGDWYFQMSSNPTSAADKLLAKAYIFGMDRLRWDNAGMSTWLEGGAVFGERSRAQYAIVQPIIDEEIPDTDSSEPTLYVRIIRFQGNSVSLSGGDSSQVLLRHQDTFSTANDGVSIVRFDFAGEDASLWCNAIVGRKVPANYVYAETPGFTCASGSATGVRSVAYGYNKVCVPFTVSCLREKEYFQVVFAEVLYDIRLRP